MTSFQYVLPQFAHFGPMLVVYFVGIILSLVNLRRLGAAAVFSLIGCGLYFLVTAIFPFVQGYIFVSREHMGWSNQQMSVFMSVIGMAQTVVRVAAFAFILAAIFSGRRAPTASRFDMGPLE